MKFFWLIIAAVVLYRIFSPGRRRISSFPPGSRRDKNTGNINNSRQEQYDDLPLQGPWSRKEADLPSGAASGESEDSVPLPGPWDRQKQKDTIPVEAEVPEKEILYEDTGTGEEAFYTGKPARENIHGPDGKYTPGESVVDGDGCCAAKEHSSLQGLFTPGGIYKGFVMAEILGSRGGRPLTRRR